MEPHLGITSRLGCVQLLLLDALCLLERFHLRIDFLLGSLVCRGNRYASFLQAPNTPVTMERDE